MDCFKQYLMKLQVWKQKSRKTKYQGVQSGASKNTDHSKIFSAGKGVQCSVVVKLNINWPRTQNPTFIWYFLLKNKTEAKGKKKDKLVKEKPMKRSYDATSTFWNLRKKIPVYAQLTIRFRGKPMSKCFWKHWFCFSKRCSKTLDPEYDLIIKTELIFKHNLRIKFPETNCFR